MTLTKTLRLNADNDLDLSRGGLAFVTDIDSLVQRVKTRLQTFRGECFLSPETGTPWLTQIFNGTPTYSALNAALLSALSTVDGLKEVSGLEYSFDRKTRILSIKLYILSESGESAAVELESIV